MCIHCMGIFYENVIYGFKACGRRDADDMYSETLTEIVSNPLSPLTSAQKKELYKRYKQEWKDSNMLLTFYIYTQAVSTLDSPPSRFMTWAPITLETFLVEFNC